MGRKLRRFFLLEGQPSRNTAMEGLRGYAVLLVFFVHSAGGYLRTWRHIEIDDSARRPLAERIGELAPLDAVLLFLGESHHGVDLFFLLSGFLIARILDKNRERFSYPAFIGKRLKRIYPAFFLSIAVAAYVYIAYLKVLSFDAVECAMNLLMLWGCPGLAMEPYNFVTWSLFYEMVFYLVFPALYFTFGPRPNRSVSRQVASSAVPLTVFALFVVWSPRFWGFFFGAGLGLCNPAFLTRVAGTIPTWSVLAIYAAVVGYFKIYTTDSAVFFPLYGLVAALLFLKTCYADGMLNRLFRVSPLRSLGNISYSFYLMHVIALVCMSKWFFEPLAGISEPVRPIAYFGLGFSIALAMSIILFAVAERWYFCAGGVPSKR